MKEKESKKNNDFRCGFVAVVGRPNSGKSTLINKILGKKIAIVTRVPQTTRNAIRAIYNSKNAQIIFVDTPGMHAPKDRLGKLMNRTGQQTANDADVILHLMDTSKAPGKEEEVIVKELDKKNKPIILGLNKVDLEGKYIQEYIELWQRITGKDINKLGSEIMLMPLSGLTGIHIKELIDAIIDFLPESVALYPQDAVSDFPERLFMAEIVREKLFNLLREEIPFGLSVSVEEVEERKKNILAVYMAIVVSRESQKKIVIGKRGSILKKAGTQARKELEKTLKRKIYLELYVKIRRDWRENTQILQELGVID